ncbi:T9SS type A sorting domain-containing protein [bacterium]|nr:T9SS type A sorting domain-containing protein [bacterium]
MRILYLSCSLLVLVGFLNAQISIDYSEFPHSFETVYRYQVSHNVPIDIGQSGPGRTWNFSTWTGDYEGIETVLDPSDGLGNANFPGATHCIYNDNRSSTLWVHDYWFYLQWDSPNLMIVGRYDTTGGGAAPLDDPAVLYTFPLDYLDTYTVLMVYPFWTWVDTDTVWTKVDGYGTVITPTGTYSCLRVRQFSKMLTYSGGSPLFGSFKLDYLWIAENYGPVATARFFPMTPEDTIFDTAAGRGYLTSVTVGVEEKPGNKPGNLSLKAFPNPFNSSVNISMVGALKLAHLQVEIYDINGGMVFKNEEVRSSFCNEGFYRMNWTPDEGLGAGIYFVRASKVDNSITRKLLYVK